MGDSMAATVRNIIRNAYRKAGIVQLGASLTADQTSVGLELLQQIYRDLVMKGTLAKVEDVYTEASCTAKENTRVHASSSSLVITYPSSVTDTFTGLARAPLDGSVVIVVGPSRPLTIRIYDAASATWEDPLTLTLAATAPMSEGYQSDLEALLAGLLADERGIAIEPLLASQIQGARYHFARRSLTASTTSKGSFM